ncbi:DUF6691 family protein [Cereibacter sphaeroides]|uniref:DUF6691 family protein n=1 Tax=Cereibacter sphaeroides TaxID=1063 RepID=UPI00313E0B50
MAWRQPEPALTGSFDAQDICVIDRSLLTCAALFGIGWGIGGFCPDAAWTQLPLLSPAMLVFLPMMLVGLSLGVPSKFLPTVIGA